MSDAPGEADETADFPPAPWRLGGQLWLGVFRSSGARLVLPHPFRPVFGGWTLVMLVRYRTGTLRYDELAVGTLARRGLRIGIWIDDIWVSDAASLRGGRQIWGLPKQLADFAWKGDAVEITDRNGPIAVLTTETGRGWLPPVVVPAPFWGVGDAGSLFTVATLTAWPRLARLCVCGGPRRLSMRGAGAKPVFAVAADPFSLTVPAPRAFAVR